MCVALCTARSKYELTLAECDMLEIWIMKHIVEINYSCHNNLYEAIKDKGIRTDHCRADLMFLVYSAILDKLKFDGL